MVKKSRKATRKRRGATTQHVRSVSDLGIGDKQEPKNVALATVGYDYS